VTAIVSPFAIQSLPLQARFYKHAFRSGTANGSRVGRLLNRIAFYACETFADRPSYGHFAYGLGESTTSIRFDARNRQYSAIYFDAFLPIYEPDVTATLLEFAPADGVFYDIGSNWGYFSLFLAATPSFKGEIHAFEPWPPTYEDLTSMVGQAGLDGVITTHRKAVGADPGAVLMQCGRHSGLAQIVEAAGAGQQESVEQDAGQPGACAAGLYQAGRGRRGGGHPARRTAAAGGPPTGHHSGAYPRRPDGHQPADRAELRPLSAATDPGQRGTPLPEPARPERSPGSSAGPAL
jgi:hypothetical protein